MILRNENVRPYLIKNSKIINLNGIWGFEFDDLNVGHKEKWFLKHTFSKEINVPFPYESKLSGIEDTGKHDYFWYHKTLNLACHKLYLYLILSFLYPFL